MKKINPETKKEYLRYLSRTELGQVLNPKECEVISTQLRFKKVAKGQNLINQCDDRNYAFFLKEGFLKLDSFDDAEELAYTTFLCPDRLFPLRGMFADSHYCYTATALSEVVVAYVTTEIFEGLLESNHHFSLLIIKQLQKAMAERETFIQKTVTSSAKIRVRQLLGILNERYSVVCDGEKKIPFPLPIKEIARIGGTTRETASQVIHELDIEQKLRYSRKYLSFPQYLS